MMAVTQLLYTCSFEVCCDRRMDGVPGHDAWSVCVGWMVRGHVAMKPDQQRSHYYTACVSQTPTGLVTTMYKKHIAEKATWLKDVRQILSSFFDDSETFKRQEECSQTNNFNID